MLLIAIEVLWNKVHFNIYSGLTKISILYQNVATRGFYMLLLVSGEMEVLSDHTSFSKVIILNNA